MSAGKKFLPAFSEQDPEACQFNNLGIEYNADDSLTSAFKKNPVKMVLIFIFFFTQKFFKFS